MLTSITVASSIKERSVSRGWLEEGRITALFTFLECPVLILLGVLPVSAQTIEVPGGRLNLTEDSVPENDPGDDDQGNSYAKNLSQLDLLFEEGITAIIIEWVP
jgi:hypothetical protein